MNGAQIAGLILMIFGILLLIVVIVLFIITTKNQDKQPKTKPQEDIKSSEETDNEEK